MLEARAAELAAPNLNDAELVLLRGCLEAMEHAGTDVEHWLELNLRFHTAIYPASGWPHLCALIATQRRRAPAGDRAGGWRIEPSARRCRWRFE